LLDVFVIDLRTYRAANNYNRQSATTTTPRSWVEVSCNGSEGSQEFPRHLEGYRFGYAARRHGNRRLDAQQRMRYENVANGNGPALGRELELARLLSYMKRNRVRNVVWLTGDVHYTAAHYYDPEKAQFQDFDPFWEFISGPLNAEPLDRMLLTTRSVSRSFTRRRVQIRRRITRRKPDSSFLAKYLSKPSPLLSP
jgi:alkaline phosphatase D